MRKEREKREREAGRPEERRGGLWERKEAREAGGSVLDGEDDEGMS